MLPKSSAYWKNAFENNVEKTLFLPGIKKNFWDLCFNYGGIVSWCLQNDANQKPKTK